MTLTRIPARLAVLLAAVLALLAAQVFVANPASAAPTPAYDSIPASLPPSWTSLGYEATSTDEFGDLVELGATDRDLDSITVGFVDWACENGGGATCLTTPGATWTHPITVNVYAEGATPDVPGALLATVTQTVTVPYRPSADAVNCPTPAGTWFNPSTSTCHNGYAFTATFDFVPLVVTVPDRVIVTVAFNTEHHGATPIGATGPYNSLNVAVSTALAPTVGTDVDADSMFLDSTWGGAYADGGAGGLDALRADDGNWPGYGLALRVNTYDILSTLAVDPDPTSGGGAAGGLPTLAATGSEPSPWTGIAGLAAVLLGLGLVVAVPRRGVHRA